MTRVRAPELIGAGGWIGTTGPLSLAALSGKIVVLDFWTSCCVNCVRVIDELRPIETRFADEVVVVGIHSPKFPREHDHRAVEQAVARLGITHPVLDDPELATWRQYAIKGWPTVVVVDPEGYVVGGVSGEGCGPVIIETIEGLIATHDAARTLDRRSVSGLVTQQASQALRGLSFPGKVAASPDGRRLAIADTGHDRVVVCDLDGRVERVLDGLSRPQGVRFDGGDLVVCDTGADRVVLAHAEGGAPTVIATAIASPWDVIVESSGHYLVAEAARHRLWRIDAAGAARVVAGTGQENLLDGPAAEALLAQPSGLARMAGGVAIADAEASALRVLTDDNRVVTLVGQGLFDWGASDGGPDASAMQHPLGVAAAGMTVYVADTFNSLLRTWTATSLSASAGSLRTLPASGLEEPGGIDLLADGRLVVADTNHHRIVLVTPDETFVEPLVIDESWIGIAPGDAFEVGAGGILSVPFDLDLGTDTLDPSVGHPVRIDVHAEPAALLGAGPRRWELDHTSGSVEVPAGRPGTGIIIVEVAVSVCDDLRCAELRARTRHDLTVADRADQPHN